ncbi:MAG: hypothetical protein M1829_004469 [Trizodia sp. TS-e1964]|nr:MAG: hypothetical protein M1829_004469 [Trizodia sp. TS-e1964]
MSSIDRDESRDRAEDRVVRHQHSFSESGRALIPMWDSSDPERAPPPLPLNPGSPSVATRPNTSANIQAAAAAFVEKARESTTTSAYTVNPMPLKREASPERLLKGQHHKRMQSIQPNPGNIRDMAPYLDHPGLRSREPSPEKSPSRFSTPTPTPSRDIVLRSPEKSPVRAKTPTQYSRDCEKDTPTMRPLTRGSASNSLTENFPPTATPHMAGRHLPNRDSDTPLANITNTPIRNPPTFDALSIQIMSLTNIATNLQREMSQLSRRSKDNATDLVSLKEATNARDEDIRKSLRDLVSNLSSGMLGIAADHSRTSSQAHLHGPPATYLLDNKAHASPPASRMSKNFSLPRIPSPSSFAASLDRDLCSPSPYAMDGAATLALLEKILREMGTREGQDRLLSSILELQRNTLPDGTDTVKKLDEIFQFMKDSLGTRDLVARAGNSGNGHGNGIRKGGNSGSDPPRLELDFDSPLGPLARTKKDSSPLSVPGKRDAAVSGQTDGALFSKAAAELAGEDMLKFLRKMKDSVSESGGITSEVKALVRDLRGEVLGMGRELGRKLEEVDSAQKAASTSSSSKLDEKERLTEMVAEGFAHLKEKMDRIVQENRQIATTTHNTVDNREIFDAINHAISYLEQQQASQTSKEPGLRKDEIIEAVRDAWERYKPDIEVQTDGLDRDEILECLKEGLESYRPGNEANENQSLSREDILSAIGQGLDRFTPPQVPLATQPSISKEEVIMAVRETLESFEMTLPQPASREGEITKDDVLGAVKEGLDAFDFQKQAFAQGREIEILKDDLIDAVRGGFEDMPTPLHGQGEQLLERIHEIIDTLRVEFQAVSDEAKQNLAANGRVTEQALDVIKDGLEQLRKDVEAYVDRAADVTGKDEIIDVTKDGFEMLRVDLDTLMNRETTGGSTLDIDNIKVEFENLRETMATAVVRSGNQTEAHDIIEAIKSSFNTLRADLEVKLDRPENPNSDPEELLNTLKEGLKAEFDHVRETMATSLVRTGASTDQDETLEAIRDTLEHVRETMATSIVRSGNSVDKDEILEAMREGLDDLRSDLEQRLDRPESALSNNAELVEVLRDELESEFDHLREIIATSIIKTGSSEDKEEILEAFHNSIEVLRSDMEARTDKPDGPFPGTGEILDTLRDGLDRLHIQLQERDEALHVASPGNAEIIDALKDGLHNIHSDIQRMENKPVDMSLSYEILETLKQGLFDVRADLDRLNTSGTISKELESAGGEVIIAEAPKRNDIDHLEILITQLGIKVEALDNMPPPVPNVAETSALREDFANLASVVNEVQSTMAEMAAHERVDEETGVKREDVEALENLLRNTKAKIEEIADHEDNVKREHVWALESVIKETKEAVDNIASYVVDEGAKKEDICLLESLLKEVKDSLEEMKERATSETDDPEKVTRTDIEAVEAVCLDIKAQIEQMVLPDMETLATKTEIESLEDLIKGNKEMLDADTEITLKEFNDRKIENETLLEKLRHLNTLLEEFKENTSSKLEDHSGGVDMVVSILSGLEETVGGNGSITTEIKEMCETISREFERAHVNIDGSKLDSEERDAQLLVKTEELKQELGLRIDERFGDLMLKYDDAQVAAEMRTKVAEERDAEKDATLASTIQVGEELKILLKSLNSTVADACHHMAAESKKAFNRADDGFDLVEKRHSESSQLYEQTLGEVQRTLAAVENLQGEVAEQQPKVLTSLGDILSIVGQHYAHSQEQAVIDNSRAIEMASIEPTQPMIQDAFEKYDDTQVHSKLDKLVEHATLAGKSLAQIDLLDQIHKQVMSTALEVTQFVTFQTKLITDEHEHKQRLADEAAIALEKRLAQKERVESEVVALQEEKGEVQNAVAALKLEKESLSAQKLRMSADLASLETAINIRREELTAMEGRAESLERRILEGVLDHSRSMLMTRSKKDLSQLNLKRVRSNTSGRASVLSPVPSIPNSAVGMALKSRPPAIRVNNENPVSSSRRILSLNQITGNASNPSQVYVGGSHHGPNRGLNNLKRSHSVKTASNAGGYLRKSSWADRNRFDGEDINKENESFTEESENEGSEGGTERRTSYGTSYATDRRSSYGTTMGSVSDAYYSGANTLIDGEEQENRVAKGQVVIFGSNPEGYAEDEGTEAMSIVLA